MTNMKIYDGVIAGVFHAAPDFNLLRVNDPVRLIPEPDNKFDANAIRVDSLHGAKLGYIPRLETWPFHQYMKDPAKRLETRISYLNPQAKGNQITIVTTLLDSTPAVETPVAE